MALQMEDVLSENVAELGGFDGMESVLTCAKPVEHVVAGAPHLTPGAFDLVFTTWGTICWLPDITVWARPQSGTRRSVRFTSVEDVPTVDMR